MKKFFVFIVGLFIVGTVFAVGENIPTSKTYVDNAVAQKQNTISANNGNAQVLTNTGTAGTIGTKNIYDSSAAYETQTNSLITAGTMNTAVQNAIDSEFVCISWVDDDPSKECLLLELRPATPKPSGKNLLDPSFMDKSTYKTVTINGRNVELAKILPTENGKTYTLSATLTWDGGWYYYYLFEISPDGSFDYLSQCRYMWNNNNGATQGTQKATCTFTTKDNAVYGVWFAGDYSRQVLTLSDYQMEEGAVATAYEPYKNLYMPSGN